MSEGKAGVDGGGGMNRRGFLRRAGAFAAGGALVKVAASEPAPTLPTVVAEPSRPAAAVLYVQGGALMYSNGSGTTYTIASETF